MGEVAIEKEKEVSELENRDELESAAISGKPKKGGGTKLKLG